MTNVLIVLALPEPVRMQYFDHVKQHFPEVKLDMVDHHGKVDPAAAGAGVNVVTNLPAAAVRAITDRYREHWAKLGRDPKRIPFMGMNRHIVVAETDREAMEIGRRAYRRWFANFTNLWRRRKVPLPKNIAYSEDFDGIVKSGQAIAGSPQTVREAIARQAAESGVNYVLARLAFGDLSLQESLRSAELLARGVMPELAAAPVS